MAEAQYDQEQTTPTEVGADKPDLKKWKHRIQEARDVRKDWEQTYKVEKCEEFFLGKQWNQGDGGPRVLNHFQATLKVTQTNLLFENPRAIIRPKPGREMASTRKAYMAEELLSAIMKQDDNFEEATNLALLQAFFRAGVIKVIYDPTLEPNPHAEEDITEKDGDGNPILNEMGEPEAMIDPMTGMPIQEPPFIVKDDTYRFEWVDAKCMLFPDSGPYMRKWPWLGEEVTVPLDEAKADERFPPELRMQFKCNVKRNDRYGKDKSRQPSISSGGDYEDESAQLFRYCELYDVKKKRWLCIAEDQDFEEALIDDELPVGLEDHPYAIMLGWTPIIGPNPSPWPLPYTYPWLDVQEEYNIRRDQQMQGAKRSARKIFYDEQTFVDSDEALKCLQSSRDMEGVNVKDVTRLPQIPPEPNINAAIWADTQLILSDFRVISGQTGAKLSGSSEANTATEASFIERASTLRDAELQKVVFRWLKSALKKMLQLVQATLTNGMFVKLRGMNDQEIANFAASVYGIPPEAIALYPQMASFLVNTFGQEKMEHVSREDLTFEAEVDIQPGSTRPRSLPAEKAQFLEFLQIIAQAPQLLMSRALLEELARKYEFLNPMIINELQMMAQMMMMQNSVVAGRGGQNTAKENTEGQGNSDSSQIQAQAARGIG